MKLLSSAVASTASVLLLLAFAFSALGVGVNYWFWDYYLVDSSGSSSAFGSYISMAVDAKYHPYISYLGNNELKCASWNGLAWNIQIVDANCSPYGSTSLKLTSAGYPCISYSDSLTTDVKYAYWNGSGWTIQTVDSHGYSPSLALDSEDFPHISYNFDSASDDVGSLRYASWIGSSWHIEVVDSQGHGGVGQLSSLVLDSHDNPHVSYTKDNNGSFDLKYAKRNGNTWIVQTVDWAGVVGQYNSIAVTSYGNPAIAYFDGTESLVKLARWNGTSWNVRFLEKGDPTTHGEGYYISLAIDSDNDLHLGWMQQPKGLLYYVILSNNSRSLDMVAEHCGVYSSLTLDSRNKAHLSYQSSQPLALNYAFLQDPPSESTSPTPYPFPSETATQPTPTQYPSPTSTKMPTALPTSSSSSAITPNLPSPSPTGSHVQSPQPSPSSAYIEYIQPKPQNSTFNAATTSALAVAFAGLAISTASILYVWRSKKTQTENKTATNKS